MMSQWSENEALMCKVFLSSLGEAKLRWFDKLPATSMTHWKQLSEAFVARFVTNNKVPKEVDALLTLKKGHYRRLSRTTHIAQPYPRGLSLRITMKRRATSITELMERVDWWLRSEISLAQLSEDEPRAPPKSSKLEMDSGPNAGGMAAKEAMAEGMPPGAIEAKGTMAGSLIPLKAKPNKLSSTSILGMMAMTVAEGA
ncbi:hypothetical protein Acr_11g0009540 [Actinidia rufa]|uniref:Retrotransposon gag domain-containing protein n=1 Tax=Actinidia rufa TaxID=165716 RepID=A0A7J0FDC0_9ERIC|nr:hypothetical protein Acr_11g0009540 [Actinidia rufa]